MPFGWFSKRNDDPPRAPEDRRTTHRVDLDLEGEFQLHDGRKVPCSICDLSIHGAETRVHETDSEALQGVQSCDLAVTGPRGKWRVCSEVVLRTVEKAEPGWYRIGAEFMRLGDLYGQMETSMALYFNRRRSPRVSVAPAEGLKVQLGRGREKVSARVRDISADGLSVTLHHNQGYHIKRGSTVDLAMQLPVSKKEMLGQVLVRHVERFDPMLILGLEFDLSDPRGISKHRRAISRFVRAQERAIERVLRSVRD